MLRVFRIALCLVLGAAGISTSLPAHGQGLDVGGSGNEYFLNDAFTGIANIEFSYGQVNDQMYFGDWDGNGSDTPMFHRWINFYVRYSNSSGPAEEVFAYGKAGDIVLTGDWDGDGADTLAVRRGATYYVKNSLAGGTADVVVTYGRPEDVVLVGDWDGDGTDTLAMRRGATYYIKNSLEGGAADLVVTYGRPGDVVLVGDWDGDGVDTLAVRRSATYYFKNTLTGGSADFSLIYGRSTDTSFAGDWNGDGTDTLGVRRPPAPTNPPFFVYGSLRDGQSGHYLIDGKTTSEYETRMPRLDLYRLSTSSYPYAVPNGANSVGIVGEVMAIQPALYSGVLASLDRYERYDPTLPPDNQIYVRELRPTREAVNSWVYVAGPRQADYLRTYGILISSGDWLRW